MRQTVLIFIGNSIYFGIIALFTDRLSGNDSYFHIKYAWLLWKEGDLWNFPWLQGTLFRDVWVDHEFLFHILLIPFVWLGNLCLAAKAAFVFWASAAFLVFYLLIRHLGKEDDQWRRFAWIWPILLAASSYSMLYRLSHTRLQALSLVFMLLAILMMEKERHGWLFPLGFLYSWLYNGSIILIPISGVYLISRLMTDRILVIYPLLYASAGIALGFVINPYFPGNLDFLWRHLMEYLLRPTPVPVSSEWMSYSTWQLFSSGQGAWFFLFLGIILLCFQGSRITRRSFFFFLLNTLMLFLVFRAKRFIEYWPFFSLLFFASIFQDSYRKFWKDEIIKLFDKNLETVKVVAIAVILGIIISASAASGVNARRVIQIIQNEAPMDRFARAAEWLKGNTPKSSIVFNSRWDTFPELFYYNHHNYWVAGLNEAFTYYLDPGLWKVYDSVSKGKEAGLAQLIDNKFHARYVISLKIEKDFMAAALKAESGLEKVWEDEMAVIFRIRTATDNARHFEGFAEGSS